MKTYFIVLLFASCASASAQLATNWTTNITFSYSAAGTNVTTNVVEAIGPAAKPQVAAPSTSVDAVNKMSTNVEASVGLTLVSNVLAAAGAGQGMQQAVGAIGLGLLDSVPYWDKPLTLQAGALYDPSLAKGKLGYFADGTFAVSKQAGVGVGGAWLGGHWMGGSASVSLGTTIGSFFGSVRAGPYYDFYKRSLGAYTAVAIDWKFALFTKKKGWSLGGGISDFSLEKGVVFGGGLTFTF